MSLASVLHEKTIKTRHALLSAYLKTNMLGTLDETETTYFKNIFSKYYTPDDGCSKFDASTILSVSITNDVWGNKCFSIHVDNNCYPTSIKRLSGSNRSNKANLVRAMRYAVEEQIQVFRNKNPLNPDDICPITNKILDVDAEVDHIIPFHILKDNWINATKENIVYSYDLEKMNYILHEPYYKEWCDYHQENAKLRWVSKEGNKIAHTLYNPFNLDACAF